MAQILISEQATEPESRLAKRWMQGMLWLASLAVVTSCAPATTVSLSERQSALAELEEALATRAASSPSGTAAGANSDAADSDTANSDTANSEVANPEKGSETDVSSPTTGNAGASNSSARPLLERIDAILTHQRLHRLMDSDVNAAWQIMHGVVCYGRELAIHTPDRGPIGAIDYAFHGGSIHGFEIGLGSEPLPTTGRTGVVARVEPGSYVGQGHPDQWLAICAMSQVPIETEIQVGGETRTLLDWSRQVQWDVVDNLMDEYSWTLIALTHYLPDEPVWTASNGTQIDWEALVEVELAHDLDSSPCGGTHRLAGLVRAVAAKQRLGLPDSLVWTQANETIERCIENAKRNRSSDGSLSSYYFVRPSKTVDLAAEIASSGHLFEFLALAVPPEELEQPWLQLAAMRICDGLELAQAIEMECGALYHALNGLRIYRDRCQSL